MSSSRQGHRRRERMDVANYVQTKVAKAMKQVELAQQQARRAGRSGITYTDSTDSSSSSDDDMDACVGTELSGAGKKNSDASVTVKKKSRNGSGQSLIVIQNSHNVQVGKNNLMIVNNSGGSRVKEEEEEDVEENKSLMEPVKLTEEEKQLLNCNRQVTSNDLTLASSKIGKHWKRIVRNLDVKDEDIERICMENSNDSKERIYQSLVRWQQTKHKDATLGKLLTVMYEVEGDRSVFKEFHS